MSVAFLSADEQRFVQFLQQDINSPIKTRSTTVRQLFKEYIQASLDISRFAVFHNYPHVDYPSLAADYFSKIDFPVCFQDIIEHLNSNTSSIQYNYVGDLLQNLCLISYNCRQYNSPTSDIIAICTQYEDQVMFIVNDYTKKYEATIPAFRQYSALQDITFKLWPPGKVPMSIQQQKKKYRNPYREEVDLAIYRFEKLNLVRQAQILASLVQEMYQDNQQSVRINNNGQILGSSINIDFSSLKPQMFWWFYDTLVEICVQEFGQDGEAEIQQEIKQLLIRNRKKGRGLLYVNIIQHLEDGALESTYGPQLADPEDYDEMTDEPEQSITKQSVSLHSQFDSNDD